MTTTTDKYINLFTDFGFKKLFGEEPNKDLLLSFLNVLLGDKEQISDLSYLKNERLGKNQGERKAVYDLYCTNERGEKLIVEIQRVKQEFFKDRSVYYSTFAIQEQAKRGKDWTYTLKGVYTIAVMDFAFDQHDKEKFEHRVKLIDEDTCKVFYDKLSFIYLEIPKFNKEIHELKNDYEKWLYAFRNLHRLKEMPKELEEGIFKKLFELAEIAKMDKKERSIYEESLKDYWDLKGALETSFKEGKEEGIQEGIQKGIKEGIQEGIKEGKEDRNIEIAKMMLDAQESMDKIIKYTGLTKMMVEDLKRKNTSNK